MSTTTHSPARVTGSKTDSFNSLLELWQRSGRDLVNMAKKRTNVIPIIEDARHPQKYRMLVGMVDVMFADVAQPDQARIFALNAQYFLKVSPHATSHRTPPAI